MAFLSLRTAAQQAGTSKSTILRAIQAGRLSATRTEGGGYQIDPSELFRCYPAKSDAVAANRPMHHVEGQHAPANATGGVAADPELATRFAVMEAELRALKEMAAELRQSRDAWQAQAERATLALAGPVRLPWWRRLAG